MLITLRNCIGAVIVIDMNAEDEKINFRLISKIYEYEENFYFLMHELESESYDDHFEAYVVTMTDLPNTFKSVKDLLLSCSICTLVDRNKVHYVGTRFKL